jgi:hypothetical protein
MRLKSLLLVLAVAGFASSFALANGGDGKGQTTTGTTTAKQKCRKLELKGTAAAQSITIAVTKANKAGHDLVGKPATLALSGNVSVNAQLCAAAQSGTTTTTPTGTLQLRVLKVAAPKNARGNDREDDDDQGGGKGHKNGGK